MTHPELAYVEGTLVLGSGDVEAGLAHAWNTTPDGGIIDSTLHVAPELVRRYEEARRWTAVQLIEVMASMQPPDGGSWLLHAWPMPGGPWLGIGDGRPAGESS